MCGRRHCLVLVAIFVSCSPGCGPVTAEVSGKVTFQGRPITSGSVILYCPDKRIVRGVIGPDGSYSISNVPVGEAAVAVRLPQPPAPKGGPSVRLPDDESVPQVPPGFAAIPTRYGVPEESGLAVRVSGGRVIYDIELTP